MAQLQIVRQLNAAGRGTPPLALWRVAARRQIIEALLCSPLLDAGAAFASAGFDERVEVVRAVIYGDLFSNTDFPFG
jgi:hypothetical protein